MRMNHCIFALKNKVGNQESWNDWKKALAYDKAPLPERIHESWLKRVRLVEYAYKNCPFYKRYYDSKGFHPSMLHEESDWNLVPILEKKMMRQYADEILASSTDLSQLSKGTTGGSTGTPVTFYKSRHVHIDVLHWRSLYWWGLSPSDNEGILHRRVPTNFVDKMKNRLLWWPTKRSYLSAIKITDDDISQFINDCNRLKIEWLQGYCAALEHVADYMISHSLQTPSIKMVWSTSSPLTQLVRKKMEKAFGCKIMDQYGSNEMGNIAVQKPNEDYLTVHADYVHVDIVDDNNQITSKNHQEGDVVITDLNTFEFPMIKYRLGDKSRMVKTMGESSDGYPKIDFVKGRISDSVILPEGGKLNGDYLTAIADPYADELLCYQVYQHEDYQIDLKLVLAPGVSQDNKRVAEMVGKLDELLAPSGLKSRVIFVDKIEDQAGKRRYIISDIALAQYNKHYSQIDA